MSEALLLDPSARQRPPLPAAASIFRPGLPTPPVPSPSPASSLPLALPVREPASAPAGAYRACDAWFGPDALAHWSAPTAPPVPCRVHRHATLVHEGSVARHLFIVQAGDFKVSRTAEDGYEQVLDFPGRGEMLCLGSLAQRRCETTVTALEDALVHAIPIADLPTLRRCDPAFDLRLQAALSAQWNRVGEIAWLMAAVGADRRTARFLLQMSRRMASRGQSPRRLRLRMSRRDIAAHLGLAHESISRALTSLAASGLLVVRCRDLEITDLAALERFARSTRGHAEGDEPLAHALTRAGWDDDSPRRPHATA